MLLAASGLSEGTTDRACWLGSSWFCLLGDHCLHLVDHRGLFCSASLCYSFGGFDRLQAAERHCHFDLIDVDCDFSSDRRKVKLQPTQVSARVAAGSAKAYKNTSDALLKLLVLDAKLDGCA